MAYIITDKCISCGACATECPVNCITYNEERKRYAIDEDICISCGTCRDVCPVQAPISGDE